MFDGEMVEELANFLVVAKRHTYAGMEGDATISTPLLNNTKQLEWRDGGWLYRDIYHGMSFFTGMEVVYFNDEPRWSMSYSGGVLSGVKLEETRKIYGFLRSALLLVSQDNPIRGPSLFSEEDTIYSVFNDGDLTTFSGREEISIANVCKYRLSFAGGIIR